MLRPLLAAEGASATERSPENDRESDAIPLTIDVRHDFDLPSPNSNSQLSTPLALTADGTEATEGDSFSRCISSRTAIFENKASTIANL